MSLAYRVSCWRYTTGNLHKSLTSGLIYDAIRSLVYSKRHIIKAAFTARTQTRKMAELMSD